MISAPITDMTAMYTGSTINTGYSSKNNKESASFGDIISGVSAENVNVTDEKTVSETFYKKSQEMNSDMANLGAKPSDNDSIDMSDDKAVDKTNLKDRDIDKNSVNKAEKASTENVKDSDSLDEDSQAKIESEIMKKVADDLDISVDELENILETLGIQVLDLLDPQKVSNLIANVKADGDMMALITDESIGNLLPTINADINMTLEEASESLGISLDELNAKLENALNDISTSENVNSSILTPSKDIIVEETEVVSGGDDVKVVTHGDLEMTDSTKMSEVATIDENVSKEVNTFTEDKDSQQKSFNNESKHNDNIMSVYEQQNVGDVQNFDNLVETQEMVPVQTVDTQDVISQIEEHLRLQMKNDITELQMQLNPENLGTVHLTIASKENGVTAQLTAQNESVKQALESQIIQLKNNLEQQGVKVEAVEVTVASHEFERNLDEGNEGNRQQQEEAERLRKATRKINVSDYFADDNIEALDEELQVTAKMMKADGNSMDYKV